MSDAAKRPGGLTMYGIRQRSYNDEKGSAREVLRMANGFRQEHAARVWQAMQAVCSMAVAYSFGCDDGDECRLWELRWVRPKLDSNAAGGG